MRFIFLPSLYASHESSKHLLIQSLGSPGSSGVKIGGVPSKAASEASSDKATASKANEDMWMKQLGRHGEEAAARERAEGDKGDPEEEEEEAAAAENEVGILTSFRSKLISCNF